jgi:hypothetical protein
MDALERQAFDLFRRWREHRVLLDLLDLAGGFTEDLYRADDREPQHLIGVQILPLATRHEATRRLC